MNPPPTPNAEPARTPVIVALRREWAAAGLWAAWLILECVRHAAGFSTALRLAGANSESGKVSEKILYLLCGLLVVRLMQQPPEPAGAGDETKPPTPAPTPLAPWKKLLLCCVIFLSSAVLPFCVDFAMLRAGPGPIWATVVAQVCPLALPFLLCVWLASLTRSLVRFSAGVAALLPVAAFVWLCCEFALDDSSHDEDAYTLFLTQFHLAVWVCSGGIALAIATRLFTGSRRAGWTLGLTAIVGALVVFQCWPRIIPSLSGYVYPPQPVVRMQLPVDYFKPVTWQPDQYGSSDVHGQYTLQACAELNHVPDAGAPFPVIETVQARLVLPDQQTCDLVAPQVADYFEQTAADILATQFPGIKGHAILPLFRFDKPLRARLRGRTGTLVLTIGGRMVTMVKRGELPLKQDKPQRLTFPGGMVLTSQSVNTNGSLRDFYWVDLDVRGTSYQKSTSDDDQIGETWFLYVLADPARKKADLIPCALNNEVGRISGPWNRSSSSARWEIDPRRIYPDDPEPQFLLPMERLTLTLFEAKKQESFETVITIPSFPIPQFPDDP